MRAVPFAVLLAVTSTACVVRAPGDTPRADEVALEPTFAAVSPAGDPPASGSGSPSAPVGSPSDSPVPDGAATPAPSSAASEDAPPATDTPTPAPDPVTVTIQDAVGDLTPSLEPPPRYADLAGATLTHEPSGYTLSVELDGGAPDTAQDGDHTMNVVAFFDTDGDGRIDQEVWANLADGGWDTAHYDNAGGGVAFSDDDEVDVAVEGDALALRFPTALLGTSSFRWSLASEWGRYEVIGTAAAARDDCPDDDRPAAFPG